VPPGAAGAAVPGGPPPGSGDGPGPARKRGLRTALVAGAALLVAGGIIAALVILLGGDDGDPDPAASGPTASGPTSPSAPPSSKAPEPPPDTDGTATDPRSGITLPSMRDWFVPAGEPETHQVIHEVPCTWHETASPETADPCYLGEINVAVFQGTSFDALVTELRLDVADNARFRTTSVIKDEPTTVDGTNAHLLVIEVEEKVDAGLTATPRVATFQYVVVDVPLFDQGEQGYPIVFVGVDSAPGAPPDSVFDTVLHGIEIGTPAPTST